MTDEELLTSGADFQGSCRRRDIPLTYCINYCWNHFFATGKKLLEFFSFKHPTSLKNIHFNNYLSSLNIRCKCMTTWKLTVISPRVLCKTRARIYTAFKELKDESLKKVLIPKRMFVAAKGWLWILRKSVIAFTALSSLTDTFPPSFLKVNFWRTRANITKKN